MAKPSSASPQASRYDENNEDYDDNDEDYDHNDSQNSNDNDEGYGISMAIAMMIMIGITVTMLAIMMMTKTKMEKAWGYAKFPECWRLGDRYEIDFQGGSLPTDFRWIRAIDGDRSRARDVCENM